MQNNSSRPASRPSERSGGKPRSSFGNRGNSSRPFRGANQKSGAGTGSYRGASSNRFGGRSGNYSGNRSGGFRGGQSHGGPRGGRKNGARGDTLDISKFINKTVVTEEAEVFVPEHRFDDFEIAEELKRAIAARNYELPTPIQDKTIPYILQGQDVVGLAQTGTGKTAAFLIPLIHKVLLNRREQVLVVTPTRELAIQINDELRAFTRHMRIASVTCVGGMNINPQIKKLREHNHFVIGTPGRLMDLIRQKKLRLDGAHTAVLDEADRMLDMGFINDMKFLMEHMPEKRHTLFFSATMSSEIKRLIGDFLTNPVTISVKTQDTSQNVEQDIVHVKGDKVDMLHQMLSDPEFSRVLIFGRTKHGAEKLSKILEKRGVRATSIHSNKSHSQRQQALKQFKEGRVQVMVATDVAARGLDIDSVSHVINYDVPNTYDDYIHRIGRTGRGNKRGKALTFIG